MTTETDQPLGLSLSEGLGAGADRWLTLLECCILAGAWLCVYLGLRTLAPADIAWWQGGALGGTAMVLVRTWWNSCQAPNDRVKRGDPVFRGDSA